MIKAVIFDIDGVLMDSLEANTKFFQNLLEKSGYKKPPRREAAKTFHMTMWDAIKFLTKEKSDNKIRKIWNLGHKLRYPIKLVRIPDNSAETLENLYDKYKLGIVIGRIRRGLNIFYKASKMRKYFSVAVCFEDYKNPKPHPEPLLIALKKLRVKPEEAVYVGDAKTDMKAAKAADVKFILYSRKKLKGADIHISSFREIENKISKL